MHWIDLVIFLGYMLLMLGVGYYFMHQNKNQEDFYVGGRKIGSWHIGLSVVATDVGGGFSIGLGGQGFIMGLSGSWMLFTGLLGAWLAAVYLIPRVKGDEAFGNFFTFPQIITHLFSKKAGLVAAVISLIGYLGFTSSQLLAGAKLASGTFTGISLDHALWIMGALAIIYTVLGGLKAVIYTDTFQWILLMAGFIFIGIPTAYIHVGGWKEIRETLPPEFFSLNNLEWQTLANWAIAILPIWFIGMTLYQRIFASRDVRSAKKAWYIAGFFEWPVMAFMGVSLGLLARVAFEQGALFVEMETIDPEMGLPLLLRTILPPGILGLMMAAYFSAVLSTADSCLMAASGNLTKDIFGSRLDKSSQKIQMRWSQFFTLLLGALALLLASQMSNVLELMLYSYSFMVAGLLIPVLFGLFGNKHNPTAAIITMLTGGGVTLSLQLLSFPLPFGLDPSFFGLISALFAFLVLDKIYSFTYNFKK
jgi:solute:Na+ symporter, SSS family